MNRDKLQFVAVNVAEASKSGLKELYFAAFPPEERRPWADFAELADNLTFLKILRNGSVAGMATLWRFDKMTYLEHFAIFPDMRCGGVGSEVLRCLRMLEAPKPLVLEAERPETGDMARRRIGFYLRNGFHILHGIDYVQPPYAPGLPPVPLLLMATSPGLDAREVETVLHSRVYGYSQEK